MNKKKLPLMVVLALVMSIMIPLTLTRSFTADTSVANSSGYKKYNRVTTETLQNGDNVCFGMKFDRKGPMPEEKYGLVSPNYLIDPNTDNSPEGKPFNSPAFADITDTSTQIIEKIVGKYNYIIEYKTSNVNDGFYIKFKDKSLTNSDAYSYLAVTQDIAFKTAKNIDVPKFIGVAYATRPMVIYTEVKNNATVFFKDGASIYTNYTTNITGLGVEVTLNTMGLTEIQKANLIRYAASETPCYLGENERYYVVSYEDPEVATGAKTVYDNQRMTLCATNNRDLVRVLNGQNKKSTEKQIYGSLGVGLSVVANIATERKISNQYDGTKESNEVGGLNDYSVIARQFAEIDIFREAAKRTVHMNATQNGTFTLESDGNATTSSDAVDFMAYDNSSVKFTFSPNSGYMLTSCKLDGENVASGASVNITRDRVGVTIFDTISSYTMSVNKEIVELKSIAATDKDANIGTVLGNITIKNTGNRDIWFNGKQDFEFVTLNLPPQNEKIEPNTTRTVDIGINANAVAGLNEKKIIVPNENGQSVEFTVRIVLTSKMSIDKTIVDFGVMGYSDTPISQNITISNNDLAAFTIELTPQPLNFIISGMTEDEIFTGGSVTLSIVPKSMLERGKYEESITIKSSIGDVIIVPLKFEVTRKVLPTPAFFINGNKPIWRYTGEPQFFGLDALETQYYTIVISDRYGGAPVQAINYGTYDITFKLKDRTHYEWVGGYDEKNTTQKIANAIDNKWIIEPMSMANYAAGTTPVLPSAKTKYGELTYEYWSDKLLDAAPTTAGTYRLRVYNRWNRNFNYQEKYLDFKVTDYAIVTFYVDGVRYDEKQVTLGESVVLPTAPTKASVGETQYTFSKWDKLPDKILAYTDVNAVFTEKIVHTTTSVPRLEPTCTVDGHKEYWTCSGCEMIFSDAAGLTETTLENMKLAKAHKLTIVPRLEPTCTVDGHKEYWTCSGCEMIFSDAAGATETTLENTVLKVTPHNLDEAWYKDEINHWHKCADCKRLIDKAAHIWDNGVITTPPTAESDGVKTYTCMCGATKTEAIPLLPPENSEIHDSENKISVVGKFTGNAELVVSPIKDVDSYKKLLESVGVNKEKIGDYLLSMTGGAFSGTLTVTFTLDSKYNGKTITILQQKVGGQIELFTAVAENGKVSVTVSELSAFMLASPKDTVVDQAGCKSSIFDSSALLLLATTLALALIIKRKSITK